MMQQDKINLQIAYLYRCSVSLDWRMGTSGEVIITDGQKKRHLLDCTHSEAIHYTIAQWHAIFQQITGKSLVNYWSEVK